MKIGNIELKYGVMLAPMAGVTDYSFRRICKDHGAEYMVSEMISAKGMHYESKKTGILTEITDYERPMAIQIFGSEPAIMAEAAYNLSVSENSPEAIDINMGCPMRKIVGNGEGSALMLEPEKAEACIRAVVNAVKIPVTVKIRSGWNADNMNAVEMARIAEAEGVAAVCVHGRTRAQMYMPPVNLDIIKAVKAAVDIPVIGNGDIMRAEDALKMFEYTGCDGVMIARGAMGNPWIFEEIITLMNGEVFTEPDMAARINTAVRHAELLVKNKGSIMGVNESRKHLAWYIKGIQGAAAARNNINKAASLDEMKEIICELMEST